MIVYRLFLSNGIEHKFETVEMLTNYCSDFNINFQRLGESNIFYQLKNDATLHDVYCALIEAQGSLQHAAELSLLCLKEENNSAFVRATALEINSTANSLRFIISTLEKVHDNGN